VAKAKRRSADRSDAGGGDTPVAPLNRIANLLALLLTKGEDEPEKAKTLAAAGYSPGEIAELLGKQPNTISAILYRARRGPRARRKTRRRR
jgi:DNA-directed RNA polymerase specialized sigma24 family protein